MRSVATRESVSETFDCAATERLLIREKHLMIMAIVKPEQKSLSEGLESMKLEDEVILLMSRTKNDIVLEDDHEIVLEDEEEIEEEVEDDEEEFEDEEFDDEEFDDEDFDDEDLDDEEFDDEEEFDDDDLDDDDDADEFDEFVEEDEEY
jgi:AAA ATPase containing von Willebrand factor type A (vWA) domain